MKVKSTMNGTDDDEYTLRVILDGTSYLSGKFGPIDSEGEVLRMQHTFGMDANELQQDPTYMEGMRKLEKEVEVHQQELAKAGQVRTLVKESCKLFGKEHEDIDEVETGAKPGRKNIGNGQIPSDFYGQFTQLEALNMAKVWMVQSKKMPRRKDHVWEGVREAREPVYGTKKRSKHSLLSK